MSQTETATQEDSTGELEAYPQSHLDRRLAGTSGFMQQTLGTKKGTLAPGTGIRWAD